MLVHLAGCNDGAGGGNGGSDLAGQAQKGPFSAGGLVRLAPLDANGDPAASPSVQTSTDDGGGFSVVVDWSGATLVRVSGDFYDETTGDLTRLDHPLLAVIEATPGESLQTNVNLFTHLEALRLRALMAAGGGFAAARDQARAALLDFFDLPADTVPHDLNLDQANQNAASANLLLFSAAVMSGDALLERLAAAFAAGEPEPLLAELGDAADQVNLDQVAEHLAAIGLPALGDDLFADGLPVWAIADDEPADDDDASNDSGDSGDSGDADGATDTGGSGEIQRDPVIVPINPDRDGDGLSNDFEDDIGTDPDQPNQLHADLLPIAEPLTIEELRDDLDGFAIRLFKAEHAADEPNPLTAPYATSAVLGMLLAGADGGTAADIAGLLAPSLMSEQIHPALHGLRDDLGEAFDQLTWMQNTYPASLPFLNLLAGHHDAVPTNLDLDTDAARTSITDALATRPGAGFAVPHPGTSDVSRLVYAATLARGADWAEGFAPDAPVELPFETLDGDWVLTPTLSFTGEFPYAADEQWQAVALPLNNDDLRLLIVMPRPGRFDDFLAQLSTARLAAIRQSLTPRQLTLNLPGFTSNNDTDLTTPLTNLGLADWTDQGVADFSAAQAEDELHVEYMAQRQAFSLGADGVNQRGATLAVQDGDADFVFPGGGAGVIITQPGLCEPELTSYQVTASRPFFYFLEDSHDALLALGAFTDPDGATIEAGPARVDADGLQLQDLVGIEQGLRVGPYPVPELADPNTQSLATAESAVDDLNRLAVRLVASSSYINSIFATAGAHATLSLARLGAQASTGDQIDLAADWQQTGEQARDSHRALNDALSIAGLSHLLVLGQEGYPVRHPWLDDLILETGAYPRITNLISNQGDALLEDWSTGLFGVPVAFPSLSEAARIVFAQFGEWDLTFDVDASSIGDMAFRNPDDVESQIPAIELNGQLTVAMDGERRLVRIPLAGGTAELLIIQPESGEYPDFVRNLNWPAIDALRTAATPTQMVLHLPELDLTNSSDFDALFNAGTDLGADPRLAYEADFQAINTTDSLRLGQREQRGRFQLSASGLSMSGRTLVTLDGSYVASGFSCLAPVEGGFGAGLDLSIGYSGDGPDDSPDSADPLLPFAYLVLDRSTGAVLYAGQYLGPDLP